MIQITDISEGNRVTFYSSKVRRTITRTVLLVWHDADAVRVICNGVMWLRLKDIKSVSKTGKK